MPAQNLHEPVLPVEHFRLSPITGWEANSLASVCPVCHQGTLLVQRDSKTYVLQEYDHCCLCAQRVRYLDIAQLRRKDWAQRSCS